MPRPDDPYEIDGWERHIVKLALLVLINAQTPQSARGAIARDLELSRDDTTRFLRELKHKHAAIARRFHSDAGRWLQWLDSQMAEIVILAATRRGIPALPIHDSFIVPQRHEDHIRDLMVEAFETVISRVSPSSRISLAGQELNSDTTYTVVELISSSPLPPPVPSCRSVLFGADRRLTSSGRFALIEAQRRRDIRQDTLAGLVGISRPALSNILARRFGASAQTAERITEVIASTPAFERQPFLPGLAA